MPLHAEPSRQAHFIYTLLLFTYIVCATHMHMEVGTVLWICFQFSSTYLGSRNQIQGFQGGVESTFMCYLTSSKRPVTHFLGLEVGYFYFCFFLAVLEIEPRALCMQGKHSMTEKHTLLLC